MNENNQRHFSPVMAALIGGAVGALVVCFHDEKRRKKIIDKFKEIFEEGKESGHEFKNKIDKSIKSGRKNLAKKIRRIENRVA